jgi:hypothetical protein
MEADLQFYLQLPLSAACDSLIEGGSDRGYVDLTIRSYLMLLLEYHRIEHGAIGWHGGACVYLCTYLESLWVAGRWWRQDSRSMQDDVSVWKRCDFGVGGPGGETGGLRSGNECYLDEICFDILIVLALILLFYIIRLCANPDHL